MASTDYARQIPTKIADGLPPNVAKEILGDRFTTAFAAADGGQLLWFFSLKGVPQPSISYYHETPLRGGYAISFDVEKRIWSSPISIPAISAAPEDDPEELLEGEIFSFKNRILLLTYQKAKEFSFRDLYEWDGGNGWTKLDAFAIEENSKMKLESTNYQGECSSFMKVSDSDSDSGVYFIAQLVCGLVIFRLNLEESHKSIIEIVRDPGPDLSANLLTMDPIIGGKMVKSAKSGHFVYAIFGRHACGFHWDPLNVFRIDLRGGSGGGEKEDKKSYMETILIGKNAGNSDCDDFENNTPRPPWSFSGPRAGYMMASPPGGTGRWLFFGGCRARGLSSTQPDQSIWELDLETTREWKRTEKYDLPEGAIFVGAAAKRRNNSESEQLQCYAVDVSNGVYEFTL